jgi:hypothetical protein
MKASLQLRAPKRVTMSLIQTGHAREQLLQQTLFDAEALANLRRMADRTTTQRRLHEWCLAAGIGRAFAERFPAAWCTSRTSTAIGSQMCARESAFFDLAGGVVPLVALGNYWLGEDTRPEAFNYSLNHVYEWTEPALFDDVQTNLLRLELLALPDGPYAGEMAAYLDDEVRLAWVEHGQGCRVDCAHLRVRCQKLSRQRHTAYWHRLADAVAVIRHETGNDFLDPPLDYAPVGGFAQGRGISAATLRELEAEWRRARKLLFSLEATERWLTAKPKYWKEVIKLLVSCYV